jgi:predicted dehydrogenase
VNILNIGIIGLGHIALNAHIPAIKTINGANLVAVADINPTTLDRARKNIGPNVKLYTDYNKLLDDDIDLVTICLPPHMHTKATLSALEAKKHVLVEKPFTLDLSEAFQISKMSKSVCRKVCLVQNYRYYPACIATKKQITTGKLGRVLCVNTFSHVQPPPISPNQAWVYGKWGIIDDYGPHPIDMTNWFISSNPKTVFCYSGILARVQCVTHLQMLITYENGSTSTISMSWLAGSTKFEVGITGSAGDVLLNVNLNQNVERHGTVTPYHQVKEHVSITRSNINNVRTGVIFKSGYGNHTPLFREFIASIVNNSEPPVTLCDAIRNVAVSEAAKISLVDGKAVNLADLPAVKQNSQLFYSN